MTANRDPDAPEIREWGRAHGFHVKDQGRIPAEVRSAWATGTSGGAVHGNGSAAPGAGAAPPPPPGPAGEYVFTPPPDVPGGGEGGDGAPPAGPAEERPPRPSATARDRRGALGRAREKIRHRAAPPKRRRVSLETLGSLAWGGLARVASSAAGQSYLPVARMMAFQAPVAGLVMEDAARGTVADTLIQPVARLVESGSAAGALLGPPLLTAVVCRRPETYPVVRPILESCMKEWVIVAGPKLRELRRREARFAEEMAEFGDEFGLSVDALIDEVFAPPPPPPAGQPDGPGQEQANADGAPPAA